MNSPALFLFGIPERGRAVLFPVAVKERNTVVFATCAHTVTGLPDGYEMLMYDQEGRELPAQRAPVRSLILPPELGTDLAFVIEQMDEVPPIARLSDRPIAKGLMLSHARNLIFTRDFIGQSCIVSTQMVAPLSRRFTYVDDGYHEPSEHVAILGQKLKNPLRGLAMRSWPGVSGSPLWDQYGNVLGMVAGGNEKLTESEPNFFLVYLPARIIKENLKRFVR